MDHAELEPRRKQPKPRRKQQRHAEPKPLVVAIAMPIRKEQRVLGALFYQYRLDDLTAWIKQINLGRSGYVFVLDHTGT